MQQLRDSYKPYESFVIVQNYLFVAHGNIISYYDIINKKWGDHILFGKSAAPQESDESQYNGGASQLYQSTRKVIKVFRHQSVKAENTSTIGVLFNDGLIELLQSKSDEFGTA